MDSATEAGVGTLALGGLAETASAGLWWVTVDEIAALYLDRVHRFAVMVCPAGADPDDLTQQAMLRAVEQAAHRRLRRETAEAWLWRVVVNSARDHGRSLRRSQLVVERLSRATDRPPSVASAESLALERIRDEELIAAVRRLPPRYRLLIALRYGGGLTPTEITRCTGSSRMAVAKALKRSLDRLRGDLVPDGEG
ncbi:MAG TPA: sigma-70 family RNA polymerase sigma factor [Candidatus Binatia bacterium]|nr:sigma-70 family RNA polymerase sigma factor [Candidatus Binatia bacterium]